MWSPVQSARYSVGCLPMGPDTTSLLACLADKFGEPPTEELTRAAGLGMTLSPHPGAIPDGPTTSGAVLDTSRATNTGAASSLGGVGTSAATSAAHANTGAVATSGVGALSDIAASSGDPTIRGLPSCIAGDWRRAFTTPLRVLHAWDQRSM